LRACRRQHDDTSRSRELEADRTRRNERQRLTQGFDRGVAGIQLHPGVGLREYHPGLVRTSGVGQDRAGGDVDDVDDEVLTAPAPPTRAVELDGCDVVE